MGGLSRIQTVWVRDLPVLSQVARLDVVQGAQGSTLVVQDPATGQLARADLGAAFGRAPVPLSSFRLEATGNAGGMVPLRIDGQDRQIEAGTLARLTQAGGTASAYLDGVAFAGNLVVLHHATPGGDAFLFATRPHGSGIDVFRTGSGLPQPVQRVEPVAGFCLSGLSALDSVEIGGRRYLVAASATENGLSSFEIGADPGQVLTPRSAIGVAQGLAIDRPTALVTAVLDGRAHVIAGAFGSGSLNVFELTGEGRLIATDQVNDSLQTRFDGVAALDAVTVGDGVLIAAGGNDGGISLFQLIPGGRLIHRETLVDGTATALDGVRQLRFVQDNGLTELWALSSRDGGLTRLALDTGGLGPVLQGAAAGGDLHGTGAADILIDGPGSDRLFGAAGADVFVFSPDAQADTVADFNRFEDRIDLGAFAGVTGPGDIALGPITGGAVLRWGDETLTLMSHDGARLGWSDLSDAVDFATQRVDLPDPFTLRGDDGDNRFGWAEGPDTIDGGAGFDTMSYADAPQGVVADLGNSRTNGLAALGDVLVGIEAVEGSAFADRLRGDEGENRLSGLGGNDMFVATPGRDWYFGDAGYDTVSYAGAPGAVEVDMGQGRGLVGIAAEHRYISVEWVEGSAFADRFTGSAAANGFRGLGGNDMFVATPGRDWYFGDAGYDTVSYAGAPGAVEVDMGQGRGLLGIAAEHRYISVEWVEGSAFADRFTGSAAANGFRGLGGNDMFVATPGRDWYFGDAGYDTVSYAGAPGAVEVDMGQGRGLVGIAAEHRYISVEWVEGSAFADRFTGSAAANGFRGGGGNDMFVATPGRDWYFGDAGYDTVSYADAPQPVGVDLHLGRGKAGIAYGHRYISVENATGSAWNDWLVGTDGANVLRGGAGDDRFWARDGDDRLEGGAGNDLLTGGGGTDIAVFSDVRAAYEITPTGTGHVVTHLAAAGDGTDTLVGIEALQFADDLLWL